MKFYGSFNYFKNCKNFAKFNNSNINSFNQIVNFNNHINNLKMTILKSYCSTIYLITTVANKSSLCITSKSTPCLNKLKIISILLNSAFTCSRYQLLQLLKQIVESPTPRKDVLKNLKSLVYK